MGNSLEWGRGFLSCSFFDPILCVFVCMYVCLCVFYCVMWMICMFVCVYDLYMHIHAYFCVYTYMMGICVSTYVGCADFRGERDDLHGDKFNELVRETASECMEIIFDNSADVRVPGARISTSFPATSISSASYSAGSAGGSSYYGASAPTSISSESYNGSGGGFSGGFGSGKMEGFGPEGPGGRKQEKPKNSCVHVPGFFPFIRVSSANHITLLCTLSLGQSGVRDISAALLC